MTTDARLLSTVTPDAIYVRSDLIEDGMDEDGQERYAKWHRVEACTPRGCVFAHVRGFADEAVAERLSRRAAARVAAGGRLDPTCWKYLRASYGSDAYVENYEQEEMARMDDGELTAKGLR